MSPTRHSTQLIAFAAAMCVTFALFQSVAEMGGASLEAQIAQAQVTTWSVASIL